MWTEPGIVNGAAQQYKGAPYFSGLNPVGLLVMTDHGVVPIESRFKKKKKTVSNVIYMESGNRQCVGYQVK